MEYQPIKDGKEEQLGLEFRHRHLDSGGKHGLVAWDGDSLLLVHLAFHTSLAFFLVGRQVGTVHAPRYPLLLQWVLASIMDDWYFEKMYRDQAWQG